jgi:hypothetical protein
MNNLHPDQEPVVAAPFASRPAHLDLDLNDPDRPAMVSALLQSTLQTRDGRPLEWQQLQATDLVRRLQWLLALSRRSGIDQVELQATCPACGTEMALPLELAALRPGAPPAEIACEPEPGVRLRLRLPNAEDQSRWAEAGIVDFHTLAADLVLAIDSDPGRAPDGSARHPGRLPDDWIPAVEEALADADPLTAMTLQSACPGCAQAVEFPVDLEQLLLQRLMLEQSHTLYDIHRLASAYHWSEQQILALTPARRAFYLACIARGQGR